MVFAGRGQETARILAALAAGRNVVITGKFGMGKTALAHHVAEQAGPGWRFLFASASQTPAEICRAAFLQLESGRRRPARPGRGSSRYLTLRARLAAAARQPAAPVLVLDDVARITAPKAALVRHLAEAGFRLIVIPDRGLPGGDWRRVSIWVEPMEKVPLGPLSPGAATAYLLRAAERHGLEWSAQRIAWLVRAAGGYPLRLQEIATRELSRARGR